MKNGWRCYPYRKLLGFALIVAGCIVALVFIPIEFWLILLGIVMALLGVLLVIS